MRKIHLYPLLILFLTATFSCKSDFSDKNYFIQKDGLISIETENFDTCFNWKIKSYYTGIGVAPDFKDTIIGNFIDYNIKVSKPGVYYVHYLGNRQRNINPTKNIFNIALLNKNYEKVDSSEGIFPEINAPVWASINPEKENSKLSFILPARGKFILRISAIKGSGYYIDKLVISSDSTYLPSGVGPVETKEYDSVKINRDDIILPPRWAFGVLYGAYTNQGQTLEVIDSLINGDFPIDAYWIDSYFWDFNNGDGPKGYIDFVGDTTSFPDVKSLWGQFEQRKIKAGIWIWNLIQQQGNEAVYDSFLKKGYFKNTYSNSNGWHNESEHTQTGSIDFENPDAVTYWKQRLKPFFDNGLDFLKLDNSSEIPFCKAAFEASQELGKETKGRGFILAHIHTTYDYRHKLYPTKWTGDAKIAWTQPDYPDLGAYSMGGLKENIGMVADPARTTYEIPFLSHDAGGYNYFGSNDQCEELYTRWIQFASMNSIMMFFSTADNPTRNHPYRYSDAVQENFRKYTHLRMRLFPYIYTYALETHLSGVKMIRGMQGEGYQYLFGNEILVAPVFEKGAREQKIDLPEGRWIDPETKHIYEGNTQIVMDAPLDKLPLLIRMGAIIPMRNYARAVELGSNDTLTLEIYPTDKRTTFNLLEDDGISNDYLEGKYARTVFSVEEASDIIKFNVEAIKGSYTGIKERRMYNLKFHNVSSCEKFMADGKTIEEWEYSGDDEIISVWLDVMNDKGVEVKIIK